MTYPRINLWSINGAQLSAASTPMIQSLSPVVFGVPSLQVVTPENSSHFVKSLLAASFGTPEARLGLQQSEQSMQLHSLRSVKFGTHSLDAMLQAGPVAGLRAGNFGQPGLELRLQVQSLQSAGFGTPVLAQTAGVQSLRAARFGTPSLQMEFGVASLASGRWGVPRTQLEGLIFSPESLRTARLGAPFMAGVELRVRTMCPARFGQPTLDRGTTC